MLDVEAVERAERQIDAFIESRAKGREEANALETLWAASERRELAKQREENRTAWFVYFSHLAHSCHRQAERYEAKAEALLDDQPKGETA